MTPVGPSIGIFYPDVRDARRLIRQAVNDRSAWCFFGDDEDAHVAMAAVAFGVIVKNDGVLPPGMAAGVVQLVYANGNEPVTASWLLLPKAAVEIEWLIPLAAGVGVPLPRANDQQDLFVISRTDYGRIALMTFVDEVRDAGLAGRN